MIHYGYMAILIGTFLEGEVIVMIAGAVAWHGQLSLCGVIFCAFLGTFLGDQFYFYIGRYQGLRWIGRRAKWRKKLRWIMKRLRSHQTLFILGFRFIYGVRTISPLILGAARIRPWRYGILNAIGASVWAMVFSSLGYSFAQILPTVMAQLHLFEHTVIGGLAIGIMLVGLSWRIAAIYRRKKNQ